MKITLVVGARPNFMKIAPIIRAIKSFNQTNHRNQTNQIDYLLVHTGQHYEYEMSKVFFEDLDLPDVSGIAKGTKTGISGSFVNQDRA